MYKLQVEAHPEAKASDKIIFATIFDMMAKPATFRQAQPLRPNEYNFPVQFFEKMQSELETWKAGKKLETMKTWKKSVETLDGPVMYGVADCILQAPPEIVLYNVQCLEQRKTWETNYTVDDLVSGDCYEGVERVVCKSPVMGFAQREMVLFRQTKCLPAFEYPYVTYCRSTNSVDATYPPGNKKTVRASSAFCGDIFWPGKFLSAINDSLIFV